MDDQTVVEIPSFFSDKIIKRLSFSVKGIKVETAGPAVFIPTENINAFRYGTIWTRGYKFIFGRQYFIETKDFNDKIFQVRLSSLYGRRKKAYHEAWSAILRQLWSHYFKNMLNYYIDMYHIRQTFEVANIKFYKDGISWDKKNKLLWNEIAIKNYRTYFMIHHVDNPLQHKACNFSQDWNALVVQILMKTIIQDQKINVK